MRNVVQAKVGYLILLGSRLTPMVWNWEGEGEDYKLPGTEVTTGREGKDQGGTVAGILHWDNINA